MFGERLEQKEYLLCKHNCGISCFVLEFNFIERSFMNEGLNVLSIFDGKYDVTTDGFVYKPQI